ncbi:hypothetical protein GRI40_11520 [Altererythrobacter aerius]|uniref:Uncharacterized protein n=1 Tax=Tsuneonella aeria TaxID=1837929 RepID=A0A6I4TIH6_9SPHN|nr:hypothetical protein [Tsuneonella aeria]MXO75845.1 hypothetical protein [Tsuneonella aeria]
MLALAGCGADDIASPGTGGDVNITIPPAAPAPTPTPTTGTSVAAGACPTLTNDASVMLTDRGTISGPTGSYRICELPSLVTRSVTLPKLAGVLYALNGRVDVGCDGGFSAPTAGAPHASTTVGCGTLTADTNVTLSIDPGVVIYARTGQSWLAVNRGNKINAVGTATAPIVFTSQDNVAGLNTDNSIGQWGGVVLLGRGRVTDCAVGTVASGTCERDTEGAVNLARFGGADDSYNAGRMSYVQLRYSGFVLSANAELQALTTGAIGTGTTLDHIQSHNSSDDGAELFGGAVNMKYYVVTGADDDSLDVDTGARANIQHALMIQRPGQGDGLMEIDSNGRESDTPRTRLNLVNFTAIQPQASANNDAGTRAAFHIRGNADVALYNGVVFSPNNECIRLTGAADTALRATLTARSVVMTCNAAKYIGDGSYTAASAASAFGSGANNNNDAFTSTLTMTFVNGANEDAVVPTDPTGLSSFFAASPSPYRIGAAWGGNTAWAAGWTCNSGYAPLGGGSNCTSLPVI